MAQSRVAVRYARALLESAASNSEAVYNDMQSLLDALSNSEFASFVKSPIIPSTKKIGAFTQLFQERFQSESFNLLKLSVTKRREAELADIAASFIQLYDEKNGITKVKVTTAAALDAKMEQAIIDKLKAASLKTIQLEKIIDETIIGGYILEYNNQILDYSIQSSINSIKRRLGA